MSYNSQKWDGIMYRVQAWAWPVAFAVLGLFLLAGCSEPAQCRNDVKMRFTSCEDMRSDQINREIDRRYRDKADCRWMEIRQPGQWEQTCDPNQKREF